MSMLLSLIPMEWLLGAIGAAGILIAAYFKGRSAGKQTEKAKQDAAEAKARTVADEVQNDVGAMSAEQIRAELAKRAHQ